MNKYSKLFSPNKTSIIIPTKVADMKPMKVIDMSTKSLAKAYLTRPVEDTHSSEEMDAVLRAIQFTKTFKQDESYAKMEEEETFVRTLPKL